MAFWLAGWFDGRAYGSVTFWDTMDGLRIDSWIDRQTEDGRMDG